MIELALLLAAAAVLVAPGAPVVSRSRLPTLARCEGSGVANRRGSTPTGGRARADWMTGWVASGASRGQATRSQDHPEPLELAAAWDLLAACLRAGMPIPTAVRAVADTLGGAPGAALRRTADLLALGAADDQAWQPTAACAPTARLARVARHSGRSGAALAESVTRLAAQQRADVRERCEASAQRAGVLVAAPLGLCFLPAFIALGVVPVVIGLATGLLQQW